MALYLTMNSNLSKRSFLKQAALGACTFCVLGEQKIVGNVIDGLTKSIPFDEPLLLTDFKTEAHYYVQTPKGIKCLLCPNECKIEAGKEGECHTRINEDGILQCYAYGNPCAIHVDPIEKKPLYHFLPGTRSLSIATAGCNLACLNCQNWEISQTSPLKTRNFDLMPDRVSEECIKNECQSISYTYSDPVAFYEYTLDASILAKEKGIKNVIVSAGYINEKPLLEWCKYIDAANIDLKSFSNEIYEMLNAGTLEPVLKTLKILKDNGVWLEITNLIVPDWTDDLEMIEEMCGWLAANGFQEYPLHFSRFNPQYKLTNLPATPVNILNRARDLALKAGLKYVYIGNVPGTEAQNTYCPKCKQIVVERKGFRIIATHLEQNKCTYCNSEIAGIWE